MRYTAFIILLSVLLQGCGRKVSKTDFPSAGIITYLIDYPEEVTSSSTSNLMPDKMTLSFSDHQIRYSFKGSFNVFSLDFYSPSIKDSSATVFRFMDNKLLHRASTRSSFFFFSEETSPRITHDKDGTKEIVGLTCKKGKVRFKDVPPFDIYYTESINLSHPNRHTPFNKVPGVLLDFCVDYNGVRFHFHADKIDYSIPEKSVFKLPGRAKKAQEKEIEELIVTLIHNFQ